MRAPQAHVAEHVDVELVERAVARLAQRERAVQHGIKDRPDIGGRTGNHAEDLGRRRLLLQGLAHLDVSVGEGAVLLLQLGEQPDVLDGDDGHR